MSNDTDRRRTDYPPVLIPADVAEMFDLPGERSAREFLLRHSFPVFRDGTNRVYVRLAVLLDHVQTHSSPGARDEAGPHGGRCRKTLDESAAKLSRLK